MKTQSWTFILTQELSRTLIWQFPLVNLIKNKTKKISKLLELKGQDQNRSQLSNTWLKDVLV